MGLFHPHGWLDEPIGPLRAVDYYPPTFFKLKKHDVGILLPVKVGQIG